MILILLKRMNKKYVNELSKIIYELLTCETITILEFIS
jgi:hypothetical protein